jgi:hypothetical protein
LKTLFDQREINQIKLGKTSEKDLVLVAVDDLGEISILKIEEIVKGTVDPLYYK